VNVPGREIPLLPSGGLSINEERERIESLMIQIKKGGLTVGQIQIEPNANGEVSARMMSLGTDFSIPLTDVEITVSTYPSPDNATMALLTNPKVLSPDSDVHEDIANFEDKLSDAVAKSLETPPPSDAFQAALDALPKLRTEHNTLTDDMSSLYSNEHLSSFGRYLTTSSCGKRYKLSLKRDGGISGDMRKVIKPDSKYWTSKSLKRNVYVITTPREENCDYRLILSKTKPKAVRDISKLPSNVDMAIGSLKHHRSPYNDANDTSYNEYEMQMLKTIRDTIVQFYSQ
jgi:hypothetical protein